MAQTKIISGNLVKNDGGTIIHAGTIQSGRTINFPLLTVNNNPGQNNDARSVSSATANIGTIKPISAGKFNNMEKGSYIAMGGMTTRVAAAANSALTSTGMSKQQSNTSKLFNQYERYGVGTWNIHGVLSKGGEAGDVILASGIDGRVGVRADDAFLNPGELQFRDGSPTVKQANYGN